MPLIHLTTFIAAPIQIVFDLSRSIPFHEMSMTDYGEKAVTGTCQGLIGKDETVTWQAKHLFKNRMLEVRISAMEPYSFFEDTMVSGDFSTMRHEHHFKKTNNGTILIDLFYYEVPYGWLGKIVDSVYLNKYLTKLLEKRNEALRQYAEGSKWKEVLQTEALA